MRSETCMAVALAVGLAGSAQAVVVGGAVTGGGALAQGGGFVALPVPFAAPVSGDVSVGDNTFQTPNLYAFNEDQNILIPSEIEVDIGTNPLAGEIVASHYVFFDPQSLTRI